MRARAAIVALVFAVLGTVGCSDDQGTPPVTTTSTTEQPTTSERPEDAFDRALRASLSSDDDQFFKGSLAAAQALCKALTDSAAAMTSDDTSSDTPDAETVQKALVAAFLDGWQKPEVGAAVLRATGAELCPEHQPVFEALLRDRGL